MTRGFGLLAATCVVVFFVLILALLWHPSHVRSYTRADKQRAQIESLEASVELFANEVDVYPPLGT